MIAADDFLGPAREHGFSFYTGVPCSFLTPLINRVISARLLDYVGATSEGEAVAIAAGNAKTTTLGAYLTAHNFLSPEASVPVVAETVTQSEPEGGAAAAAI